MRTAHLSLREPALRAIDIVRGARQTV